jgi:pimeloyl-ACP methyl ester carboxylesterase
MAFAQIQGLGTHYEITGRGEPLVLVHGLGSSARDWELQIPFFARNFQVVAYDVRGHGRSDKPPGPYGIPLFAQDLAGLINALDIGAAHIVGISLGGMIGFQLAVDSPELVRSLVVVNSLPEMVVRTPQQWVQVVRRLLVVRFFGMRKMGEVLARSLFPEAGQEEARSALIERWAENDPRAYRETGRAIVGWSISDRLEEIACPVLVITADQDYTPVEAKAVYAKKLRMGKLIVIEHSRHATPVDQPEAFNDAVMAFLQEQG